MTITARNPLELLPIGLAVVSATLFFGLPVDQNNIPSFIHGLYVPSILASIPAFVAILFGFRYVKQKGRNNVVGVGVLVSMLLLVLEFLFLLNFYLWGTHGI